MAEYTCPNCGGKFGVAYKYGSTIDHQTEIIKCPRCNKEYKHPDRNHCRLMEADGLCILGRKKNCRDSLGFEDCLNYRECEKPPLGCSPWYVNTSARICELCEAIKRYSTEADQHDKIKLWCKEILMLNEMDRELRYEEKRKVWKEDKDGHFQEVP